ncbi:hypothetical protein N9K75_00025 [bacterium]|nr:hypothetical protein [bacterium]
MDRNRYRASGDYPGPYPKFEGLYKMPYPNLKNFKKNTDNYTTVTPDMVNISSQIDFGEDCYVKVKITSDNDKNNNLFLKAKVLFFYQFPTYGGNYEAFPSYIVSLYFSDGESLDETKYYTKQIYQLKETAGGKIKQKTYRFHKLNRTSKNKTFKPHRRKSNKRGRKSNKQRRKSNN